MAKALPLLEETLTLSNGMKIPRIQLGVYMMSRSECRNAVPWALEIGYRAVDCAQMYHNEREAGQGITAFLASDKNTKGLTRNDIFYTTKQASNSKSYDEVRRDIRKSVQVCGLGYVDLFLLHSPYGGKEARLTSWRAVEDAIADGEVRMGGVSNYGVAHIEELMASKPKTPPVINQIEVHPFNTQTGIRDTCAKQGIAIEAYAPLARGMRMKHPKILELAKVYGCTPAQLFVKYGLQHGLITLPKSTKKERVRENADVEGFTIDEKHMKELDALDERLVTDWDPTEAP